MAVLQGQLSVFQAGFLSNYNLFLELPSSGQCDALFSEIDKISGPLHGTLIITAICTKEGNVTKILVEGDEDVNKIVELGAEQLAFEVDVSPAPLSTTLYLSSQREDDMFAQPKESSLTLNIDGADVVEQLRSHITKEHELDPTGIVVKARLETGELVFLTSVSVVRDFLLNNTGTPEKPLSVVFAKETNAESRTATVAAFLSGAQEEVSFTFQYRFDQPQLVESLKNEVVGELELPPGKALSLFLYTEEGEAELSSDRVLLDLLTESSNTGKPLKIAVREAVGVTPVSLRVKCTYQQELQSHVAEFQFSYTIAQDNVLESLRQECKGEFDIDPESNVELSVLIDSEYVPIVNGDRQLREILTSLEGDNITIQVTTPVQRVEAKLYTVEAHGGDEGPISFPFKHSPDDPTVLTVLKHECIVELELPNEPEYEYDLEIKAPEGNFIVTSDKQLIDALLLVEQQKSPEGEIPPLVVYISPARRVVSLTRAMTCTMGDETAELKLTYNMVQDGLLSMLVEECKAPFELFPNDEVIVSAIIDGEDIPLVQDTQLRDILANCKDEVLKLRMVEKKSTQEGGSNERTVIFYSMQDDEECETVVNYVKGETEGLLQHCINEIRKDLYIPDDQEVRLHQLYDDGGSLPLNTDEAVAGFADNETVRVVVIVEESKSPQLDRNGELELLSYDWQDILEDSFDARDLHQVIGILKNDDGTSLSPSDAINIHLTEFASRNRARPVSELLSLLHDWTRNMSDAQLSSFCHRCRDIIDFIVNVSFDFRLKRAIASSFRTLAIQERVNTQELARLLLDTGDFQPDAVEAVVEGAPQNLTILEFKDVMIQFFGEKPQDLVDFLSVAKDVANPTRRVEKEIGMLRRKRLRADLRHNMDGVSPFVLMNLQTDFSGTKEPVPLALFYSVAALLGANCCNEESPEIAARDWILENVSTEDKAGSFITRLSLFTSSSITHTRLTEVCQRMLAPELEPSALLQLSTGTWALGRWALKATQLVCHNKRVPFPPIPPEKHVPRSTNTSTNTDSPNRAIGLSSPSRLRAQLKASRELAVVPSPPQQPGRYDYKYTHLCRDLGLSEDLPTYSLKDLLPRREEFEGEEGDHSQRQNQRYNEAQEEERERRRLMEQTDDHLPRGGGQHEEAEEPHEEVEEPEEAKAEEKERQQLMAQTDNHLAQPADQPHEEMEEPQVADEAAEEERERQRLLAATDEHLAEGQPHEEVEEPQEEL